MAGYSDHWSAPGSTSGRRGEGHEPDHLGQCPREVVRRGQEPGKLGRKPGLLVALELGKDVLLGREMKVERAPRDPRLLSDDADVGPGHAGALELGDRRRVHALTGLPPLGFAPVQLIARSGHRAPRVHFYH